jgi:beta-phosphoglucomutase-like phosphatase (HAD superfamily)
VTRPPAAILDIDGTLVDTKYHHAVAWFRAFRRLDQTLPLYRIHRHIGMGGDQPVGALEGDLYKELIDEVRPLAGARELADGWTTSADVEETKPEPDLRRQLNETPLSTV